MDHKIKKIVKEVIKEIISSEDYSSGGMRPSSLGGPYGAGHKNQLAGNLDPSVAAIEDSEQAELGQNIEDQRWGLNKFSQIAGEPFQDINARPRNARDFEAAPSITNNEELRESGEGGTPYKHLPGFPGMNALETPVQHVPNENLPVDDLRAGNADGTEEYLIDDILDELEEAFVMQGETEETMGHMATPHATMSPVSGFGAVLFPRKFVPDDAKQASSIEDHDMDGISDRIDLDRPPELAQRVKEGVNKKSSNSEFIKKLVKEEILRQLKLR